MFFVKRKGSRGEQGEPVSKAFVLKGVVQSMTDIESPVDGRKACLIELYSELPVMVSGETEHRFRVYVPNYNTEPRFNHDRMKFWLCYEHQQPVVLDEQEEPSVPLIGEEDFDYFTGRTFFFNCLIVRLSSGREVVEIDYSPKD